ncbi:MBL fold metallo-hydrolase [Devosia ureilytica]|nr:MBL fold metallo-hydrolase [Devosia ureilytica]
MLRIITVSTLPGGMLNAFILIHGREAVLVDTGLPGHTRKIGKALATAGLDWGALRAVILTHGHIDHAGSAAEIARLSHAPIHAHEGDVPYLIGQKPLTRPTGWFGRIFRLTGMIERPYPKVAIDAPLQGAADATLSFWPDQRLTLIPTPGHTPGSLSVLTQDGQVLAGDLLSSGILLGGIAWRSRTQQPPFEEDTRHVVQSLQTLLDRGARRFYLGHGGPVSAGQVQRHVDWLIRHRL